MRARFLWGAAACLFLCAFMLSFGACVPSRPMEPALTTPYGVPPAVSPPALTPMPPPVPTPPGGYPLALAEEFDTPGKLDESLWGFETGPWPYNEELECYTEDNAFVEDGCLVIEARQEEREGRAYTSARLTTKDTLSFTYGYLEVRAAMPSARGTWSAIWLLPSDTRYGGYLKSGEIDIAEHVGYDGDWVYSTLHTEKNNATKDNAISERAALQGAPEDFHVYGLLWEKDKIETYLDGDVVLSFTRKEGASSDAWPFDVPFHLLLNVAVGGAWGGNEGVDDAAFPARMRVDYVRYYCGC